MFAKLFLYSGQYLLNWLNLLDHFGNTLLFGDADETLSARTARARDAGQIWAKWACSFLTFATKMVTFGKVDQDHCQYALDKSILPNSREIWSWSTNSFDSIPVSEVQVIEVGNTPVVTIKVAVANAIDSNVAVTQISSTPTKDVSVVSVDSTPVSEVSVEKI